MLSLEEIKNSVLVGGVKENDIYFIDLEKLNSAVEAINRFEAESNEFIKESMLPANTKASEFIQEWKKIHTSKVNEVIEKKEAEHKAKLERIAKAEKLLPKVKKAYNELETILNEINSLDNGVLKSPFMSIHSHNKRPFEEIHKDFKYCMEETLKGIK